MNFILFYFIYAFTAYMPWDLYLNGAEVTPELRECVLAYDPEYVDYSRVGGNSMVPGISSFYLACLEKMVRILTYLFRTYL